MIQLRPYQQRAVDWLCEHERGLVVAPAGSGKTVIAAAAIDVCMGNDPTFNPLLGWICNTREQLQQAEKALTGRAWASTDIYCAAAGNNWSEYNGLIVDEAHHATAPEWKKQIESCQGVRWGFTATPWGRDAKRNQQLREMFGNNVFVIEREEVDQVLCPARVVWLDACDEGLRIKIDTEVEKELQRRLRFSRYRRMPLAQARGECAWTVCADLGIAENSLRNWHAKELMLNHREEGGVLVLVNSVEHAKWLASAVHAAVAVYSKMPKREREDAIWAFRDGKAPILVATSLADEGFDAPVARTLILVSGGRNENRTIQRTGRVLRPAPGKECATIYDFKDTQIPLMHRHAQRRAEVYQKLGYAGDYSWL